MATGYSVDLREKVLNFVSSGASKRKAGKVFGIGEDSVYRWIRLQNTQGNLNPKKPIFSPKKIDPDELRKYVETNPDHTLKEIAAVMKVSFHTVWKWLKRLKITIKKKRFATRNVMKKNVKNLKNRSKHSNQIKLCTLMKPV
jgi:putative transposase